MFVVPTQPQSGHNSHNRPSFQTLVSPATAGATRAPTCTAGTCTVTFTDAGLDTFTVPAGVKSIAVTAVGARGGNGATVDDSAQGGIGGHGTSTTGTLTTTPGDLVEIIVGAPGSDADGEYGGASGDGYAGTGGVGTGGGGGTTSTGSPS